MSVDRLPALEIRHNPMLGRYAMTLCCIARNEAFFLDAFLAHYRALGVDRFIVLDDRSTDGSFERLAAEPDVMLVGSDLRYGEDIPYPPAMRAQVFETRAVRLWRDQLMNQFCTGQWAVVADTDEFLSLPEGMGLPDLAARLERDGLEAVWGTMVDMYPERVSDLTDLPAESTFSLEDAWYFDGRRHFRLRDATTIPRGVYAGSRARLFAETGLLPQGSFLKRLRRRLTGYHYAPSDMLYKVPLLYWRKGDVFRNCHTVSKPVSTRHMLPIMHFKFTADLPRKIDFAIETKGYSRASRSYRLYRDLLDRMQAENRSFLCPISRRYRSHADFQAAGIARL